MSPVLSVENLTLHYGETLSLWDISLEINAGQLVGVIGPNGAGKSSFLKAILGLVKPSYGRAVFWGKPLRGQGYKIAYIPQKDTIDWSFPITVKEFVLMGRYHYMGLWKRPSQNDLNIMSKALKKTGLSSLQDRQIAQLSGGQKQRLFIARAIAGNADLYLLDEPFQGVDMRTEESIISLLKEFVSQGKTVVLVHHDMKDVENYFDSLVLLNTALVSFGPVNQVFTPKTLDRLFSKNHYLFDEAKELSSKKTSGTL